MSVPSISLNIEQALESGEGTEEKSIVSASVRDGVEEEKCVVAQYRTSIQQKKTFASHLAVSPQNHVPIEWVIDIADESNGWFYGTAYHFDDTTKMLHVMVPDKENPSFDGHVLLDHRTVHLIECVDGKTDALFNKIVRDSVIKVKWDVEWFEEVEGGGTQGTSPVPDTSGGGSWVLSSARYYIRIANQLLVEDKDSGQESRGFVILTADLNLKLLHCHKAKGIEDFNRLIAEGIVQSSPEGFLNAKNQQAAAAEGGTPQLKPMASDLGSQVNSAVAPTKKLADMSRGLRECLADILDDRDKRKKESMGVAKMFSSFALDGDLDEGLKLLDYFQTIQRQAEKAENGDGNGEDAQSNEDKLDAIVDDANYLAHKLERSLAKAVKTGSDVSQSGADDADQLRKSLKRAKKELEEKEKELNTLRKGRG